MMKSAFWTAIPMACAVLGAGCSSLLPVTHSNASAFNTYAEARAEVEGLVPMKSSRGSAKNGGTDFSTQPNTKALTHADVVRLLVPAGLLKREDLDPGIIVCMEARDACTGLDITASRITKARTGNFFADFTTYRQRVHTTGWRFNALILYVNDQVVYRSWGGQPTVDEVEEATKPLGPFQDMGPSLVSSSVR